MTKNILIVEDDENLRSLLRELIFMANYNILEAANGQVALEIIADQQVDLIITDIDMPIKNGLELLAEIRQSGKTMPIVILTGGNYNEKVILAAGANAFVQKPYISDISTLVHKMAAA